MAMNETVKKKEIMLRVPPELAAQLERQARSEGQRPSQWILNRVEAFLNERDPDEIASKYAELQADIAELKLFLRKYATKVNRFLSRIRPVDEDASDDD
jgi:hypothetical protein